jgi:hypothetical protein
MDKPLFTKDELKMPQENFGTKTPNDAPSYIGILLGILIVILILILGGLYLWGEMIQKNAQIELPELTRPTAEENNEPESNNAEADVETLGAMSTSDDVGLIEADLESTTIHELDTELNAIDAEFVAE